jgi:ribosomal protein S27AE
MQGLAMSPSRITKPTLLRYCSAMGERRIEVRCAQCGEVFLAQRISARFCAGKCRQLAYLRRRYPPGETWPPSLPDIDRWIWRPTPPVRD